MPRLTKQIINLLLAVNKKRGDNTKSKIMKIKKIRLKTVKKRNPLNPQASDKYYVQAVKTGNVNLEWLAELISNQSTVREPDCLAVLSALVHNMIAELSQGRVVELGSLGSFQVGVHSFGSDNSHHVTIANVKSTHLNFRPSSRVKKALASMQFTLSQET